MSFYSTIRDMKETQSNTTKNTAAGSTTESTADKVLDTSGLLCPEPVMMLHNAVREIASGNIIEVIATDPSTERDIPKFCSFLGHELLLAEKQGETFLYRIKKA